MILESKFHGEHAGIIYFSIRNFDLWFWGYFRDFVEPKFLKNVYLKKYALLFSTDSRNGSEIKFHYRKISSQIHFILIFKVIRRKMKVPISVLFNLNFLKKNYLQRWNSDFQCRIWRWSRKNLLLFMQVRISVFAFIRWLMYI